MQQMDASVYHRRQPPSIIIHCFPFKLRFLPVSQAWLAQMPPQLDLAPPLVRALSLLSSWTAAAGKKALSCCGSHQYPSCLLPEAYLMSLPPSGSCGAWALSSLCKGSIFCSSSLALLDAQLLCCSFNWLLTWWCDQVPLPAGDTAVAPSVSSERSTEHLLQPGTCVAASSFCSVWSGASHKCIL